MQDSSSMSSSPSPVRTRLLESAERRFAAEGALATTLEDVRADAGASVGAIYHHFPDKRALLDAVRTQALADFQAAFVGELERHPGAEEGVRAIVALLVRWCDRNRDQARLLLSERPSGAERLNRELFERVRGWWRPHVHRGAMRDLDLLLLYALWLGPAMELVRQWLGGRAPKPTKVQITVLADAAWANLKEAG